MPGAATPDSLRQRLVRAVRARRYATWLELFVVFNFACLTGDILIAHSTNQFQSRAEYIPLAFSVAAAAFLFAVLLLRPRWARLWIYGGHVVGWLSVLVGAAGVVYHLDSNFFYERTLLSLTYAAPFAAPLAYMGLGCLLLMNRMVRDADSEWAQWVIFFALGGFAGNFVLSLTDHATNGFFHWTEWLPVISSAAAVAFLLVLLLGSQQRNLLPWCVGTLVLQIAIGVLGFFFHVSADLQGISSSLFQNVLSGAPPFAPLLLPNLSLLGLLGILALQPGAPIGAD